MGNCARHENAVGRFFPRCAPRYTAPRCRGAALLTVFGMSRYAIYVDVGYLYAEGGRLLSGLRQPRHAVHLDYDRFVPFLSDFVGSRQARHELLRIYWYDGARGAPTPAQLAIGYRDQIKLRLGLIDASGQQRGVDALFVRDLVMDAHHRSISDAWLVTGDDDLRGGSLVAQELGVRVHLIGLGDRDSHNQARSLLLDADSAHLWDRQEVSQWMQVRASIDDADPDDEEVEPLYAKLPAGTDLAEAALTMALDFSTSMDCEELEEIIESWSVARQGIPPRYDKPLIWRFVQQWPGEVGPTEKRAVRSALIDACRKRLADLQAD